jgi:two-component system response regulator YesN
MSCIDDFIDQCYDLVGIDSYLVREKLYEFYRTIKSDSITKGIILDNIVDRNGLALYQAIFQYDLLMNISDSFSSLIQNYEEECMKIGGKKLKKEIAKILMYVNANLSTDLSITHVAGIANMSESYFSHLFKNEMGISFVDYVNRVRIEKAKEMLVRTELRVNEIG